MFRFFEKALLGKKISNINDYTLLDNKRYISDIVLIITSSTSEYNPSDYNAQIINNNNTNSNIFWNYNENAKMIIRDTRLDIAYNINQIAIDYATINNFSVCSIDKSQNIIYILKNSGTEYVLEDDNNFKTYYLTHDNDHVFKNVNNYGILDGNFFYPNKFLDNIDVVSPDDISGDDTDNDNFKDENMGGKLDYLPANIIKDKIVLIQRGIYNFTEKIKNAMTNGAIGVIIYNRNDIGDELINMGVGDINNIAFIPSIFIGNTLGQKLLAKIRDGNPVKCSMYIDDNNIVQKVLITH